MKFKLKIVCAFCLALMSAQSYGSEIGDSNPRSPEKILFEGLRVWRSEIGERFETYVVLSSKNVQATFSCTDGSGPVSSAISIVAINGEGRVSTHLFSGSDFYCNGVRALIRKWGAGKFVKLQVGETVNVEISLIFSEMHDERVVEYIELSNPTTGEVFRSAHLGPTHWLERLATGN